MIYYLSGQVGGMTLKQHAELTMMEKTIHMMGRLGIVVKFGLIRSIELV